MLQGFQVTKNLSEGEMYLTPGDGTSVPVHSMGVVYLHFGLRVLVLSNRLYVPCIHKNLIIVTHLGRCGYTTILRDTAIIKKGKVFICSGIIMDSQYIITPDEYAINNSILEPSSSSLPLKRKIPSANEAYL